VTALNLVGLGLRAERRVGGFERITQTPFPPLSAEMERVRYILTDPRDPWTLSPLGEVSGLHPTCDGGPPELNVMLEDRRAVGIGSQIEAHVNC
jgi:hypothetical protein